MYTREDALAGLFWQGEGWYAQRSTPEGGITRKVGEPEWKSKWIFFSHHIVSDVQKNTTYSQRANDTARKEGLGTPFYLTCPNDIWVT